MPRIQRIPGPYRFFFTSFDCREPSHVHVERDANTCKFWLDPLALARNHGFTAHELTSIRRIIEQHHESIMEAWYAHCGQP